MDLKRISSGAIVVLAVAILLLIPNKFIVSLLLMAVTIVAMREYLNAISKVCKPIKWIAYLSCIIVIIVSFFNGKNPSNLLMYSIPTIILLLFSQVIATDMKTTFKDMAYTFLGIAYISIFMMFLSMINNMENGKILLGFLFAVAWGTDVCAYYIGSKFGKHKFSKVSPKKSIEGCIAGTLGSVIFMTIYTIILNNYFNFEYSYFMIALIGVVLSLIAQIGDFAASCIKRYVDIKDYSNLLPGHGGILDRIDSILFIAPFAYMLFIVI